ncbi:adenylate/guanylate cyclase domain-containing protein [Antrihabitans sp. NCIMB 15449]|uniref:Adenylate/guanylate cyclase domain-containing protein n=1 Tax=Antrihabitans spumae TaxID=3373370 RepID=A0ABW7JQQ4_9NOCA
MTATPQPPESVARHTTPRDSPGGHGSAAVVFLDMSGYTALTEVHGDERAADIAERLATFSAAALADGDRIVKTLGDAVLLTSRTARTALALIARILDTWTTRGDGVPVLRGGVHYGPVVERNNDVFGATVNLAARVAAAAATDQILLTAPVATAARAEGLRVIDLGPRAFRNVSDPVPVYALGIDCLCGTIDPVCRMRVDPLGAPSLTHGERRFWFCSTSCTEQFTAEPDRYLASVDCVDTRPTHASTL